MSVKRVQFETILKYYQFQFHLIARILIRLLIYRLTRKITKVHVFICTEGTTVQIKNQW